jgi:hypothetical protein
MPEFKGSLRTPRLPSAPVSPITGEMYYDTTTNVLYWWNGTTWISASGSGGSTDLRYNGNWAAGSYTDGDIVIASDGLAYIAVKPTTAPPKPWATGLVPGKPTYGTTLPASPVDGQEAILVDSLTAPTYSWRFRYNISSTARDKWEFVGGAEWLVTTETSDTATWAGYANLPNGPSLTIPRTGVYNARLGSIASHSVAGGTCYLALTGSTIDSYVSAPAVNYNMTMDRSGVLNVSAGTVVQLMVAVTVGTGTYQKRHLSVLPVRVS